MGLFKNITKALKKAAPIIGGTVGFGLGGPMGAAIGSGIGGLAAGQDVEDALKTAAIGGALGYGASRMGATPFLRGTATAAAPTAAGTTAASIPGVPAAMTDPSVIAADVASAQQSGSGIMGALGNFAKENPLTTAGLGIGALGLLGMTEEEEEAMERRPFPEGEMFDITTRSRDTGETLFLTDPGDRAQYEKELATVRPFYHGGEVEGPGTGTSDSVPARLSDGEFVMTAKAVRGAGGGDRDIGAARMYDMMAELEAQA